ncbi:MAG: glycosyltransferase involved in cell wall biosynthesis [Lentimonas sp.]
MKIAILSPFYPLRGGIAQFADSLADELENEHEIQRFSFSKQYPSILFPGKTQFVEPIKENKSKSLALLDSTNPISYKKASDAIKEFAPDILITAYWMSFISPSISSVSRALKNECTTIGLVHNLIPHEPKFFDKPFARRFIKQQKGIISLSQKVESQIKELNPKVKTTFCAHPNYMQFGEVLPQEEARKQLGIKEDAKVLLFFGLIRDYKGLHVLLNAFDGIGDEYRLIIAGECYGDFSEYEKRIKSMTNSNAVRVDNRFIGDDEVATYFSSANLCVLPYLTATQSGVTAIANQFELPSLVTRVGALAETIEHNKNGLLCEPNDVVDLRKQIVNYFSKNKEQDLRKNLSIFNRENSWANFSKKLIDFANSIK